jgi:hypothetical protein
VNGNQTNADGSHMGWNDQWAYVGRVCELMDIPSLLSPAQAKRRPALSQVSVEARAEYRQLEDVRPTCLGLHHVARIEFAPRFGPLRHSRPLSTFTPR